MEPQADPVAEALRELVTAQREYNQAVLEEIRQLRPAPTEESEKTPAEEAREAVMGTVGPRAPLAGALDRVRDEYDQRWWDPRQSREANERNIRANFELIGMLFAGARQLRERPVDLRMSERLERAWRANLFERGPRLQVVSETVSDGMDRPPRMRAMDTQESGFGAELVGAQYADTLWEAARNLDGVVDAIPTITMEAPTAYVPIDGALPEMLLVSESTEPNATPYTTSKTASNRRTLTAKKFTIQQIWSAELNEDSIVNFVQLLRDKLAMSAALHLGSAMYNGDTTNAGTGNINSDDADPADTRHYLAFDGIRHYWLVDDTGNEVNGAGGAITTAMINQARSKLFGANNSVNTLDNINWGQDPRNLRLVINAGLYTKLLELDEVKTLDKYGGQATIVTGELARLDGIPILVPAYAAKTEADGKLSATAGNNTLGQASIFNTRGWLRGIYRPIQLFFDRIQRTDQFLVELYTRQAFNRWGADVAAGVRNVTSD
jgi:HK97 family phage major capsid protein